MKRADQHTVINPAKHTERFDADISETEVAGIDAPSEKQADDTLGTQPAGALPVDAPGTTKTVTAWQTSIGDEAHADPLKEQVNADGDSNEIVHTGSGADPEKIDDTF